MNALTFWFFILEKSSTCFTALSNTWLVKKKKIYRVLKRNQTQKVGLKASCSSMVQ